MSNRERWIVYPLLFFAVGLGLKNQLVVPRQVEFSSVRCRDLVVESETGASRVMIGEAHVGIPTITMSALVDAGQATATKEAGETRSGDAGNDPVLAVPHRVVELTANANGGMLRLFGPTEMPALWIGHDRDDRWSGLTGEGRPSTEPGVSGGTKIAWPPLDEAADATTPAAPEGGEEANNPAVGAVEANDTSDTEDREDSGPEKAAESE